MKFPTSILTLLAVIPSAVLGKSTDPSHKNDDCYYAVVDFGCDIVSIVYDNTPFDECSPYYNKYCEIVFKDGIEQFPECKNLKSREAAEMLIGEELKKAASGCGPEGEDLGIIGSRCGPEFGSCGGNLCCSKYGFCGITMEHCSDGCRQGYGNCLTHEGEIPLTNVPERCGPLFGRCIGEDECCSQFGYCGTSESHCNIKSQLNYGVVPYSTDNGPISTVEGRCGESFGGACAKPNQCCSQFGYCGEGEDFCDAGCQVGYGYCNPEVPNNTKPTPTSTRRNGPTSTVAGRCGSMYGGACADPDLCCSQYGYCGDSEQHCGVGCQSEFGYCDPVDTKPSATTITVTSTVKVIPTSTVAGRCGARFGKCAKANHCCSEYGYCGTNNKYCGAGCQLGYGICK